MNRREYYKTRIMALMADIENKRNRYHRSANFEVVYPQLTEEIWNAIDSTFTSNSHKPLALLVERLNKLSDSF